MIIPMTPAHADPVLAIYRAGIAEGNATFETSVPAWDAFDQAKLAAHRFVFVEPITERPGSSYPREVGAAPGHQPGETVLGWIAVSPVSSRPAYSGVVEHSVYVAPSARGRGIATALLRALIASTEAAGIWTIQSGVFPENTASLALHARLGFRAIGTRERIGLHHGIWRDVVLIERRSPVVT